jgi:hypothetical protein
VAKANDMVALFSHSRRCLVAGPPLPLACHAILSGQGESAVKTKRCPNCGIAKPRTEEYWGHSNTRPGGWQSWCRECQNRASTEAAKRNRLLVLTHYSNGVPKCSCCGESNLIVLILDHIDGGGSQHRRTITRHKTGSIYRWIIKNNFPVGFRVLCRNCDWSYCIMGRCDHSRPAGG